MLRELVVVVILRCKNPSKVLVGSVFNGYDYGATTVEQRDYSVLNDCQRKPVILAITVLERVIFIATDHVSEVRLLLVLLTVL